MQDLSDISMAGKTAIITGSNSGLGLEAAVDFARRQCRVILACRNAEKAENARKHVRFTFIVLCLSCCI